MRCLVTAGKHVNNMQAVARHPPIATREGLLLDSPRRYIMRIPGSTGFAYLTYPMLQRQLSRLKVHKHDRRQVEAAVVA
jgi:hypothetical protein